MGVSHYWFNCLLNDSQYDQIFPFYKKAESEAVLSKEAQNGLDFWKKNQDNINWQSPDGEQWNNFLCAFDLGGFEELAHSLITTEGKFANILTGESVPRFIILNRYTPVSVLWYAMGFETANKLPGKMGNLLINASKVEGTLKKVKMVFDQSNTEELASKAISYLGLDERKKIMEIITMLPNGLEIALENKCGIIFLACVQL